MNRKSLKISAIVGTAILFVVAGIYAKTVPKEAGLEDTIVVPMAVAAMAPSVLKPDSDFAKQTFETAIQWLAIDPHEFLECVNQVKESLGEILEMFGLSNRNAFRVLDDLMAVARETDYAEAI